MTDNAEKDAIWFYLICFKMSYKGETLIFYVSYTYTHMQAHILGRSI